MEKQFAIGGECCIGEKGNPVTEDGEICISTDLLLLQDVEMPINEMAYIFMSLKIFFGERYQLVKHRMPVQARFSPGFPAVSAP